MNHSNDTCIICNSYDTCSCKDRLVSSLFRNEFNIDNSTVCESAVKEISNNIQHLPPSCKTSPITSTEKNSYEGFKNYSEDGGGSCIVSPYSKLKFENVSTSSCFRIEWKENFSAFDKKSEKEYSSGKKHMNKGKTTLTSTSNDKVFQKRRHKMLNPLSKGETFKDKMPYVCFECKKMFGYYSSLDEHENSHALNKLWSN
ncbi:hypothetical protein HNY73_013724 [Argiope bruennichi]|uniref:C2H2-type domain-containing protein n=1 Tax=Argiope bruennichi TaxID=94029 RepID=A0A8T0EMU9_ARGBR|nr:hypothetical protein HNY73_013724 [Argiope bruennichi]